MKKKHQFIAESSNYAINFKLPLFMKISLFLLFFAVFQLHSGNGYAQKAKISIVLNNATVEQILDQIERKSEFVFLYNDKTINKNRRVSVNADSKEISQILSQVFAGTNVKYTVVDKQIILSTNQVNQPEQATSQKIKGTVVDAQGEPLIGVNVLVKGTTIGVITDFDGNFELEVPENNKDVSFSYIGYKTQEIRLTNKIKDLKVVLLEDTKVLGEVVVTAMGIERAAKSLTYATQSVKGEELTRAKDANFINALQGKTAGLVITPNSGGAGSASKLLLRGNSSIMGNNSPLIVIDGIPMSNKVNGTAAAGASIDYAGVNEGSDALSTINPDDIESINLLKGANAAALYGSMAANGVLMITTKKGSEGKVRVDVSSSSMFETPMLIPKTQNIFGADIEKDGDNFRLNELSWGKRLSEMNQDELAVEGVTNVARNNIKDFFNTGTNFNNTISISGGTEKVQSYLSAGNTTSAGIIPNNKFNRTILNMRETFHLFNNKLDVNVSANYVHQKTNNPVGGGKWLNPLYNLYTTPRNVDMKYYKDNFEKQDSWISEPMTWRPAYDATIKDPSYYKDRTETYTLSGPAQNWFRGRRGTPSANNPYWITNRVQSENLMKRFYTNVALTYHIIKGLDAQARFSYDRTDVNNENRVYATTVTITGNLIDRGQYSKEMNWREELYTDFLLTYNKDLPKDFTLNATVGASWNKSLYDNKWMRSTGPSERSEYTDPSQFPTSINEFYFDTGYAPERSYYVGNDWYRSVFGTASIGWRGAIYLDITERIDWSRAFTQFKDKRKPYYDYYSIGGNIILNELIKMPQLIDRLKFRASYSLVGNSIPNELFTGQKINTANGNISATIYSEFETPVPEEVGSFETGFDLSLFDARLNLEFTYYNTHMYNQYLTISAANGKKKPINSGEVRNRGVETTLSYNHIFNKDWRWKTGINFSYNENKILKTYKDRDNIFTTIGAGSTVYARFRVGGSYGDLYARDFQRYNQHHVDKGVKNLNGELVKVGDIMLSPQGAPMYDTRKGYETYIGNTNAKINLGWHNTISWKNLSLYFLIDGKIGGKVLSFTEAYLDYFGVSERTGNARTSGLTVTHPVTGEQVAATLMPDGNLAPAKEYYQTIGSQIFPTEYIYDATNFRLRELSLGYTFQNVFGPTKNISVSVVGRNLLFIYKKAPIDPDTSLSTGNALGGIEVFSHPTARSYGLNIKLTF